MISQAISFARFQVYFMLTVIGDGFIQWSAFLLVIAIAIGKIADAVKELGDD